MKRHPEFLTWLEYFNNIEERLDSVDDSQQAKELHLELAILKESKFLQKAAAIAHYQKAYKLDSDCKDAISEARRLYWELGRINTIEKLLQIEIKMEEDETKRAALIRELVEVFLLLGDYKSAQDTCAQCMDNNSWCQEILEDLVTLSGLPQRADELVNDSDDADDAADKLFRAALLKIRSDAPAEESISLLRRAIFSNPMHRGASFLFEKFIVENKNIDELLQIYNNFIDEAGDNRAQLLYEFGKRLVFKHKLEKEGLKLLEEAFKVGPSLPGLAGFLFNNIDAGETEKTVKMLLDATDSVTGETLTDILELAASQSMDNPDSKFIFDKLLKADPENLLAKKYFTQENEENEMIQENDANSTHENDTDENDTDDDQENSQLDSQPDEEDSRQDEESEDTADEDDDTEESEDTADEDDDAEIEEPEEEDLTPDTNIPDDCAEVFQSAEDAEEDPVKGINAWKEAWSKAPGHPLVLEGFFRVYEQTGKFNALAGFLKKEAGNIPDIKNRIHTLMNLAKIYEEHLKQDVMVVNTYKSVLKEKENYMPAVEAAVQKYESMERWPDLVKMLKLKGELTSNTEEKVEIFLNVAKLFLQKFSNQAEAIKAFEAVLEASPSHEQAIEFLKDMYQKRRDWDKLIGIFKREIDNLEGDEKIEAAVNAAQLASEKIKRPNICIELWEKVLQFDAENESALTELSSFYERAKEWEKLADVLDKILDSVVDTDERAKLLLKLGQVTGDKINDDERAVNAWKALLEINPDDRRAGEQIKKRYLAMQAWEELEEFYAATGKWDEFIRVLERESGKSGSSNENKISLNFKIAQLWVEKKERPDRAIKCYEEVLKTDKTNLKAAEALIPILEESNDKSKLADVLEVKLGHIDDEDEVIEMHRTIAAILENDVKDNERAFDNYCQVFLKIPMDDNASEDLERTAKEAGIWEKVVDAYKEAGNAVEEENKLELKLKLARVLNEELGRAEDALEYYGEILEADSKNPEAVKKLEKIYAQMGRFEELLDIYSKRLEIAEDDEERKEILYNQALLWEEEVSDNEKAIAVYKEIVDLGGDEHRLLTSLDRLYQTDESWNEIADVLVRRLDLGLDELDEEIELKFRLATLYNEHLEKKEDALSIFKEILTLSDNKHEGSINGLETLLEDDEQQAMAGITLAEIYEENENFEKLVHANDIVIKHTDDEVEKAALLVKSGDIYSQMLSSPERAFVSYSQAFKADPLNEKTLALVEEVSMVLDSYKELAELLEEGADSIDDTVTASALWVKSASISYEQLDDIDRAITDYKNALSVDGENLEIIEALENLYGQTDKYEDLVGILKTKVDLIIELSDKENIYSQIATIYEEMLEKPSEAITSLQEITSLNPSNIPALAGLDRLFVQTENWPDLADNLLRQLALTEDNTETLDIKLRLGEVRELKLDEAGSALENYREVLLEENSNEKAIAALERILEQPEFRKEAAEILQPAYKSLQMWEKLIKTYEIKVEEEDITAQKIEFMHQMSELYETALDEPDKSFDILGKALTEDPSDTKTMEEVERLTRVLSRYDDLAALLKNIVQDMDDMNIAASYQLKIAGIFEEQLQDIDNAIIHYKSVLEIDPTHLSAASALERAYQINENYEDLAKIYISKVEMVPDAEEQKELLFKASQIYEELLENTDKAMEVYLRILDIDADDLKAINCLEALYLRLEKWEELQEIYNRKVDLLESQDDKKEVLYVLGAVYEQEINDTEKAIETYQRILEFDPDDKQGISRLDVLFTQSEKWHDLLSILEREVELSEEPDEVYSFKFRIGKLFEEKLDDPTRAIEHFQNILGDVPDHESSINMLETMIENNRETMMAARVLEPLYKNLGDWKKLIKTIEAKLAHTEDTWQKVEYLHEIANFYESDLHLSSPEDAFDTYAIAFKEDNSNEKTLESLENLASIIDRWEELASLLDGRLEDVVEADTAVTLGLRSAIVYEEKLQNFDEAIVRYQKVLEFDGENRVALTRLDKLFQISERWEDLVSVLQKESYISDNPDDSIDLQFRLGRTYQDELSDNEKAVDTYRDILAAKPEHEASVSALELIFSEGEIRDQVVEILEPLYRMQSSWDKLISLYKNQLEDVSDSLDKLRLFFLIAETYEDKLVDQVEAFNWYCQAYETDPHDERALEEIKRLAEATDAWEELGELYKKVVQNFEDEEIKHTNLKRVAVIAQDKLTDIAASEKAYKDSLNIVSDDMEVLSALDDIYTQYMEWDKLANLLDSMAAHAPGDDEKVEYIFRRGEIFETQLDEPDAAIECFHSIIDDLRGDHSKSLEHLEIIYVDNENWPELYNIYNKMKDATDSDATHADLFAKMAVLSSECLDDVPRAIEFWNNVIDILGEDWAALEALTDLYSREENWSELVDILDRSATIATDDESRIKIYSQLGLVWGECLERDHNAVENWENVLGIDPNNLTALKSIATINEKNKEWEDLIETLGRLIDVGAAELEDDELKGYYAKLGTIYTQMLEQPMDAIDAWKHALDLDINDLKTYESLESLYENQQMWEELVSILNDKSSILTGDDKLASLIKQADILEENISEPQRAKEPYLAILESQPLHDRAFTRIEEILTEDGKWNELTEAYAARLKYVFEKEDKIKILHAAARVYEEKLEEAENAFVVAQRAFEEDYSNDKSAEYLERLATITGKWEELLTELNQTLQSEQDKNIQIALCLNIGKWYAEQLGHPEYAIAYYQQVLQMDPDNVSALRQMGDLYRGTKQWDELVGVLKLAVKSESDPNRKKELLVDMGQIYDEHLDDSPEAGKAYKEALEIDSELESAISSLIRLLKKQSKWNELVPVINQKIGILTETDDIIEAHMSIGDIYENELKNSNQAIDEYSKIVEIDNSHLPALKGLERLYTDEERWQDLMDILEIQLEYATSERERISLLSRISKMLEEEFLKPDDAALRLEEVLEIDPSHEDSLDSLERLYQKNGRWHDLIATYEKHLEAIHAKEQRAEILNKMGKIYATEIDDVVKAIESYEEILTINPENETILDELAKMHTKAEDWSSANDTLLKLANVITDPERKVDLYFRLGKLGEENLLNRAEATENLKSALDIEPGHLNSLALLHAILIDEGDWMQACRVIETEQENTEKAQKRSLLQYELGDIFLNKLSENDEAVKWFEEAINSDPENASAAEPLVSVYLDNNRFEDAEPLLDMLVKTGKKRPSKEIQPFHSKLAKVSDKLGDLSKALKYYETAYEMDTSHLPSLIGLADVHYRSENWDKSFKYYQMILVHHRDKQSKGEIVEIFFKLGHIKAQLKERRKALNMFDKALEINNGHKQTLKEVIELHDSQKNYDQVIHYKKILIDHVDNDEKFTLHEQIGDIWQSKLKNPQKAISSYVKASEIKPDNRPIIHKMMPLYQATKQWQKVVEIIDQVCELEEDSIKLGRLFYSMGVIYRDEIKSADDAIEKFNISLDKSLENLKAFEAIDKILTQKKDWKNLERNYRKMLHRVSGKDKKDLETNLWHYLGEIYRTRMKNYKPAAEAFKMASQLDPDNALRHEILAELYSSLPENLDDAVAEHQWLIKKNPYRVESYKALRKLYFNNRQYDKSWCLCSTLAFLKKADAEEQQFFEQYRTRGMVRAQARLDNEKWLKNLFSPEESLYVGKIFESVTNAVRSIKIQPIKVFGLKKNQKRPANDTMTFSKTFFYAAQVLNIPQVPELYIQEDKPTGLNFAITEPMASACGANLLTGYSPQDLLFLVGKHLTYYRPEHYIRWVLPTHAELKTLLLAAMKIGSPDFKLPKDKSGTLAQYVQVLKTKLNPMETENLGKIVRRFLKAGENVDIKKWINTIDLTGCRTGFLLANDLEVAARMIQSEQGTVDEVSPKEKIKELVLFSISEDYFQLRETLGITIGT